MQPRQRKSQPEQGSGRRQVARGSNQSPAFSYYAARTPEASRQRAQPRQEAPAAGKRARRSSRSLLTAAPFWLLVALAIVCAGKVLTLSTNPKVVIVGNSAVTANYQQSANTYAAAAHRLLASSATNRSKLTVNLDGTAQALERQFPELQTVSLGVPLVSSRPIVYVQIAQPSIIMQTDHGNYALNKAGVVLAAVHSLPVHVPLMVDQSGANLQPGKQYLPSSTMHFIQTVAYQLSAAHLTVSTFILPAGSPYELDARLEGKPYMVRFNLEADALTQSGAANATIQQLGNTTPGSYIDVRVPDRVYYK